jgi:hypothetical protein
MFVFAAYFLQAQKIKEVAAYYYRSNPFNKDFGSFIKQLTSDPSLYDKQVSKITDTSLYFFEGWYKSHSPFFFKSEKTKIVFAERQLTGDSINTGMSYFIYQLVSYATSNEEGRKDVESEYKKFTKKYKKGFQETATTLINNSKSTGELSSFKMQGLAFSPLTAAWLTDENTKENMLIISILFIIVDNYAYLPIPPDTF